MNRLTGKMFPTLAGLMLLWLAGIATAAETRLEQTVFTSGKATLILADDPLRTMTEIPFTISLIDASGHDIPDAELEISLDMPAMPMPPNHPAVSWQDGAYRGKAVFTMAGAWQFELAIRRPDHEVEQVVFNIDQVLMK